MPRSLEELVGAQLIVGLPGTTLSSDVAEHLRAIRAGGVIAFERNYESPEQFRRLVGQLEEALERSPVVMVDHEGGRIVRFTSGLTRFLDPLAIGQTQPPADVERQGTIEARELRALGVHVNLAPCVDVIVEGSDPVIGNRSYGNDPHRVAVLATARIRGLQAGGVAACAKHFPGLGAVPKDPHTHLPTVHLDWPAMRACHLIPFQAALQAGVATVMSSHVCYPKLDSTPRTPATFSRRLIQGLLRDELGFQGLVVTDDLEMGALQDLCEIGEAAVRSVEAGHDILLICHALEHQRRAFSALCQAYRQGRLQVKELEPRAERIRRLSEQKSCSPP